jgi:hypothetical protein
MEDYKFNGINLIQINNSKDAINNTIILIFYGLVLNNFYNK